MIFLDLDETLWMTVPISNGSIFLAKEMYDDYHSGNEEQEELLANYAQGVIVVDTMYGKIASRLHPQAKQFIRACQQIAPTNVFTYGEHELQDPIANEHGLGIEIYSISDSMPQDKTSILVDNNPGWHVHCRHKLQELGINQSRLIQVESYGGQLFAKNLMPHLPQIKQLKISVS